MQGRMFTYHYWFRHQVTLGFVEPVVFLRLNGDETLTLLVEVQKKKLLPRLSSKKKEKNHWVKKVKKSKCNVGGKGSNNNPWGELKPNKGEKEQVKTNTVKELLNTFKSRCSSPHCQK